MKAITGCITEIGGNMVSILFSFLIFVVFVLILVAISKLLPIPAGWMNILYMILGLCLLIWVANYFGVIQDGHWNHGNVLTNH